MGNGFGCRNKLLEVLLRLTKQYFGKKVRKFVFERDQELANAFYNERADDGSFTVREGQNDA